MVTRRQHYVWRYYLSKWENSRGLIWCLRDGNLFHTNPINIMVQRDFYKLRLLTKMDIIALRGLIVDKVSSPLLRELHDNLMNQFAAVSRLNDWIHSYPESTEADRAFVRKVVIEAEEWLQSGAEHGFVPIIERILTQDTKILDDDDEALDLIYFLCMQYFRTKNMRDRVSREIDEGVFAESAKRVTPLLCHCAAVNVAHSLYLDRKDFEIVFVESPTAGEFIAGDQPVMNPLANADGTPPEELALYYPVCPRLAIILAPKAMNFGDRCSKCDLQMQQSLNDLVAVNAQHSIVANSHEMLMTYRSRIAADTLKPFMY